MITNIGFRTPFVVPSPKTQQRMRRESLYDSFDVESESGLGLFRALLWTLICEAAVISGIVFCWMLIHHTFRA
jgi:hypothetical protein